MKITVSVCRRALVVALLGASVALVAAPAAAAATITSRGPAYRVSYPAASTTTVNLSVPSGTQVGDVLVAAIGFGRGDVARQPTLTPPAGWTLVNRTNHGASAALAVFWHVHAAGETRHTWRTDVAVGGVGFLAAFGGVDRQRPVDAVAGRTQGAGAAQVATPSVTTTAANTMLVAAFYGYDADGRGSTWSTPTGMTELGDVHNSSSRSGALDRAARSAVGATGATVATASRRQDAAVASLAALRPAATADTRPPTLSGIGTGTPRPTEATIVWATDETADSQVQFGPDTSYGRWTQRDGVLVRSHTATLSGLTPGTWYHLRVRSRDAAGNQAISGDVAFRTPTTASNRPIPLIVDTDIFSDADDVGALATAFALQQRGEARVVAIGVNTRTDRPSVATSSWRCAAAVAQFYGSSDVPIGTHRPDNGTDVNTDEFAGPCARRARSSTPAPDTAVRVFRRALVGQPDGSVAVVEAGYDGNLADLLRSPGDSISPLSGRELVARKVRVLVVMGGGFPSRNGENNLVGDVAAAQAVTDTWPTRLVWSGKEIGDAVQTGSTITRTHPDSSPVRVAYEAFVGADKWIDSYDLTAVYHAIRPNDSSLSLVGPGRNTVTSTGANRFTSGSGNQWYLRLRDAPRLENAIDDLLEVQPHGGEL